MHLIEPASKKPFHIILAEDDEDDFYIFNHAMSSILGDIKILHTADGNRFSSMIQCQIRPDVIFLDINMPYKNGITCLKEIRSNAVYNQTRVVIYSTAHLKREIDACYDLGANFYLIKPADFFLTKLQLRDLLQNDYFKMNKQPSRNEFVMNYQKANDREFQHKLTA